MLGCVLSGSLYAQQEKVKVGDQLPDIELCDPEGNFTYLLDYVGDNEGEYLLIYFWTCPACIKGTPEIVKAIEPYQGKLDVVAVNVNNDPDNWARLYATTNPFPWPNLSDGKTWNEGSRTIFPIPRFPTFVLVNSERKILNIWSSGSMSSVDGFAEQVAPWLGEGK